MRRIGTILAALAALAALFVTTTPTAQADQWLTHYSDDGNVSFGIYYHNYAGDFGWRIRQFRFGCDPLAWNWDEPAVDGKWMNVHRNIYSSYDTIFHLGDAESNVDSNEQMSDPICRRYVTVDVDYPNADTLDAEWYGIEQRNAYFDHEFDIRIVLKDGSD